MNYKRKIYTKRVIKIKWNFSTLGKRVRLKPHNSWIRRSAINKNKIKFY